VFSVIAAFLVLSVVIVPQPIAFTFDLNPPPPIVVVVIIIIIIIVIVIIIIIIIIIIIVIIYQGFKSAVLRKMCSYNKRICAVVKSNSCS